MDNKKQIVISVVAAFVVLFLIYFVFISKKSGIEYSQVGNNSQNTQLSSTSSGSLSKSTNTNALVTVPGGTREIIQEKIATPDVGSNVPQNVAKPTNVLATDASDLRQFEIKAQNGKYDPSIIVVNEGDLVNIVLNAIDGDYNMYFPDFGNTIMAKKGALGRGQFTASPYGQYKFFCDPKTTPTCPPNMSGTLIVNKK
jgi:hypothetical protein